MRLCRGLSLSPLSQLPTVLLGRFPSLSSLVCVGHQLKLEVDLRCQGIPPVPCMFGNPSPLNQPEREWRAKNPIKIPPKKSPSANCNHIYLDNSKLWLVGESECGGRSTYYVKNEVILSPRQTGRARGGGRFFHIRSSSVATQRARALHPLHPSLPASRLSLPFGLRHRFPSLLPFLSIHRGDFFQHPSVSLESRREERGTGREGGRGRR